MFHQSRVVCCIFYSLDDLNLFIDKFKFADSEFAYIYHDKDKYDDGSLKEPHYHFYGRRNSPLTDSTLSNFKSCCTQNFFYENLKSNDSFLLNYFTHANYDNKFHYDVSSIVSNFDVVSRLQSGSIDNQKVLPSVIISMFDEGYSTVDIIRKFPKLIYSVSNLYRYERLLKRSLVNIDYVSNNLIPFSKDFENDVW